MMKKNKLSNLPDNILIGRLSDLPKESSDAVEHEFEKAGFIKQSTKFDENGLRYDSSMLQSMRPLIMGFPLEIIATFVDIVTKTKIDNNEYSFFMDEFNRPTEDFDFSSWNTTSFGNIAYIHLYSKNEWLSEKTYQLLLKCAKDFYSKMDEALESEEGADDFKSELGLSCKLKK